MARFSQIPNERMRSMWDSIYAHPEPIDQTARRVVSMEPRWASKPDEVTKLTVQDCVDILRGPPSGFLGRNWRGTRSKHYLVTGYAGSFEDIFTVRGVTAFRMGLNSKQRKVKKYNPYKDYERTVVKKRHEWWVLCDNGDVVTVKSTRKRTSIEKLLERYDEHYEQKQKRPLAFLLGGV